MSDITKCSGQRCKLKDMCHRYTAKPGMWQSYFAKPPIKKGKCDMFWGDASDRLMDELNRIVNIT